MSNSIDFHKGIFLHVINNYQLLYEELLDKANSSTINVARLRFLGVEICKTINNLNPSFMKQISELRETNRSIREKYRLDLNIPNYNRVTFSKNSLKIFGPNIWNSLPYHIKSSKNLESFIHTYMQPLPGASVGESTYSGQKMMFAV